MYFSCIFYRIATVLYNFIIRYRHCLSSLIWLTSLKNLSFHSSSISGPITDLRTSRNSAKWTPRSPSPLLLLARLLFGPFGCVCVPLLVRAFLRSSRCSGLSLSAGLSPPASSLHTAMSRSVRKTFIKRYVESFTVFQSYIQQTLGAHDIITKKNCLYFYWKFP